MTDYYKSVDIKLKVFFFFFVKRFNNIVIINLITNIIISVINTIRG